MSIGIRETGDWDASNSILAFPTKGFLCSDSCAGNLLGCFFFLSFFLFSLRLWYKEVIVRYTKHMKHEESIRLDASSVQICSDTKEKDGQKPFGQNMIYSKDSQ